MDSPKTAPTGWQILNHDGMEKLRREFAFTDFKMALEFVNKVGEMAEKYHHHPLIELEWGKATVWWWTHKTKGLTDLDIRLAEQTNQLQQTSQ